MSTVFTEDVINYNFLPEKYAGRQSMVIAELNILCEVDWQTSIHNIYRTLVHILLLTKNSS